jgi:hypothetical protein
MTDIYLMPYHSLRPDSRILAACSGQFALVERAIMAAEWPYDNGDDPSFYVARRYGGPLTWGVCRADVRSAIQLGSIVVFCSYTKTETVYRYRMSAVATVAEKWDRRSVFNDLRCLRYADKYLNLLIRPDNEDWKYNESDRHKSHRHPDWLWRIADHGGLNGEKFRTRHLGVYDSGAFSAETVRMARNYVVFSFEPDETYISPNPPEVAVAERGEHELWIDSELKRLTIDEAAQSHPANRGFLRSRGFGFVHPELRFAIASEHAPAWRRSVIAALKAETAAICSRAAKC